MIHPRPVWHSERRLIVPSAVLHETARLLAPFTAEGVECPVIWLGVENDQARKDTVTTVILPAARRYEAHYEIPESETTRLSQLAWELGVVPLAQLHTHPTGLGTKHSPYDDTHAMSLGEGFLSLIVADYAAGWRQDLESLGVHDRQRGWWHYLTPRQKKERLSFVPTASGEWEASQ